MTQTDGARVLLGSADALTNDVVDRAGNAALALGLLGSTEQLVWYLPSLADVPVTGPPSLDELTPSWVAGVTGSVVITAILAMFWRGRRFGPLVIEDLPVAVRASETMEGRARLYQRSGNRQRALDALRIGTVSRLAVAAGLSRHASVVEVADTVAGLAGIDPRHVRSVLLDAVPDERRRPRLPVRSPARSRSRRRARHGPHRKEPSMTDAPVPGSTAPHPDDLRGEALAQVRVEVGKAVVGQDGAVTGPHRRAARRRATRSSRVCPASRRRSSCARSATRSSLDTKRVQFTPDLMPGDVTGSLVYDAKTGEFEFREGPVFTNILLADEINRTPPKTQSALLEAMEERQVTRRRRHAARCRTRSSSPRRRTRSSTRAPTRCPRRSSTAS